MRTTRGLPFNASYACTFMQEFCDYLFQSFFFLPINPTITNSTRGWPLLGLPTAGEQSKGKEKAKHKRANRLCICVFV